MKTSRRSAFLGNQLIRSFYYALLATAQRYQRGTFKKHTCILQVIKADLESAIHMEL